jgi:hypothetical protein
MFSMRYEPEMKCACSIVIAVIGDRRDFRAPDMDRAPSTRYIGTPTEETPRGQASLMVLFVFGMIFRELRTANGRCGICFRVVGSTYLLCTLEYYVLVCDASPEAQQNIFSTNERSTH